MNEVIHRVEQTIAQQRLLADGEVALVAVSGGVDSMVLLNVLHALSARHNWKLVVAHLNHGLRGCAADLDERFVRRYAEKLGLRCETARENVKAFARARKLSVEMAAREVRHDFLARTARALGIGRIALAHHADDQVELFFLRLARGAGTQGLGGMDWRAPSSAARQINLVRPLLSTWKSELLAFAKSEQIPFRTDATNDSTEIPRNRVRNELLPFLRRHFQTEIDRPVLRSMELIRTEHDFLTAEALRWRQSKRAKTPFAKLHAALQRRVVQLELLTNGIVPRFDHVEMLRANPEQWLAVGPALLVRRTESGLIERQIERRPGIDHGERVLDFGKSNCGSSDYGGIKLDWRLADGNRRLRATSSKELFDAGRVGARVLLRHWRAGDRFQPIGMPRTAKLQDLFVNQKIPRECRHKLVLATTASGEIFWVEGLRIGENFKVTPATKRLLEWRWRRKETLVAAPEGEC